jgi:peptidoglycan/LPS O-acetylase OafA/YrhL
MSSPTTRNAGAQQRLLGLDALRIVAAALVVFYHFGEFDLTSPIATVYASVRAFPLLQPPASIGSIGVEVFFLISGFVITASAAHSTANAFARNRLIRLAPALWTSCLVALAARAIAGEPLGALIEATAKSAILSPVGPYIDGVVWTLIVEAVFYLMIYAILRTRGPAAFHALAVSLGMASGVYLVVLFAVGAIAHPSPAVVHLLDVLKRFPFKVLLLRDGVFFALGMLLWGALRNDATRRHPGVVALLIPLCVLEVNIDGFPPVIALGRAAIWLASAGALVLSVRHAETIRRWVGDRAGTLRFLGDLSYPLYLNHFTLGAVLVFEISRLHLGWAVSLALALSGVVAVSVAVLLGPEKTVKAWLQSRLGR